MIYLNAAISVETLRAFSRMSRISESLTMQWIDWLLIFSRTETRTAWSAPKPCNWLSFSSWTRPGLSTSALQQCTLPLIRRSTLNALKKLSISRYLTILQFSSYVMIRMHLEWSPITVAYRLLKWITQHAESYGVTSAFDVVKASVK